MNSEFRLKGTSDIWKSLNSINQKKLTRSGNHPANSTKYPVAITVTGTDKNGNRKTLGVVEKEFSGNYHINNRPKAGLGDVEIRIGDQYGMLLKATVNFTVYDLAEFIELEKIFLRPNNKVDIDVRYINGSNWDTKFNPNAPNVSEHNTLRIFDLTIFKFKFINGDTNTFVCTFECMGSSNMVGKGSDIYTVLETVGQVGVNHVGQFSIRSPIDIVFYNILRDTGGEVSDIFAINSKVAYNAKNLLNKKLLTKEQNAALQRTVADTTSLEGILVYPAMPDATYIANRVGFWTRLFTNNEHTGVYITLGYLVNVLINTFILPASLKQAKLKNPDALRDAIVAGIAQTGRTAGTKNNNDLDIQYICSNKYLRGHYFPYLCSAEPMKAVWITNTTDKARDVGNYTVTTPTGDYAAGGYDFNAPEGQRDTFKFNYSDSTGEWADLTKILINVDEIVRIFEQVRDNKETKDAASKVDQTDKPTTMLSIHDFLKKIFALIKSVSGGMYDIELFSWPYYNEDELKLTSRIYLVNTKYINTLADGKLNPVLFDPLNGDDITITASTTMDIPNDAVAMNAYATNINSATGDLLSENNSDAIAAHRKAIEAIIDARTYTIPRDNFKDNAVDGLRSAVTEYVNTIPKPVIQKNSNVVYPLKLTVEIDGINGFKFGDIVGLDHLNKLSGYEHTVFRTLAVVHTISNNAWKTAIESVCDLDPDSVISTEYADYKFDVVAKAAAATKFNSDTKSGADFDTIGHQ